jgi:sugar lactone lactonase YvrE
MADCMVLIDDGNLCGEAPIWDAEQNKLYWTDCSGSKFFSYDWATQKREVILEGFEINGCALNQPGGFIFSNNSGVWVWDGIDDPMIIATQLGGIKLQLNDCIADPRGRLLSGTCFYNSFQEYSLGHLVCVERDGSVKILDEGFHLANGLCFSSDSRTLYLSDSVERTIYTYSYNPIEATVSNRRVFVRLDSDAGLPDGLTMDAEGFVWSAEWYGSCIARYDPDGKLERRITLPAKQISSLAFGGPELTDIFITSAGKPEPMPVMPLGYNPTSGYVGGSLFGVNVGIQGRIEYKAKISTKQNREGK